MNIFILTFHKYDKAFASDLYLIYNRSPAARVCKSDTDRLLMLYLVLNQTKNDWFCRVASFRPRGFPTIICHFDCQFENYARVMLQIISSKVLRIIRVKHEVILKLPIISGIKYKTKTKNILQSKMN